MQYGHFDSENREYVITNPATPAPWANYLGDPEYGAIISNNAAGYSFVKSGANGRLSRFRFNSDMALPGRYIYIRDNDTADYWSASWQPVGKPLDKYTWHVLYYAQGMPSKLGRKAETVWIKMKFWSALAKKTAAEIFLTKISGREAGFL